MEEGLAYPDAGSYFSTDLSELLNPSLTWVLHWWRAPAALSVLGVQLVSAWQGSDRDCSVQSQLAEAKRMPYLGVSIARWTNLS